jgi:hypothetical protein
VYLRTHVRSVVVVGGDDCVARGEAEVFVQVVRVAVGVGARSRSGRDGANEGDGNGGGGDGELHCKNEERVWRDVLR